MMKPNDKNIESEIVLEFEKIRPAITRLLQSQTGNKELNINLGKSKNINTNEIIINPSILVNSVTTSKLDFKELIIGTVVHEAIHSMQDYNFEIDKDLKKYDYIFMVQLLYAIDDTEAINLFKKIKYFLKE